MYKIIKTPLELIYLANVAASSDGESVRALGRFRAAAVNAGYAPSGSRIRFANDAGGFSWALGWKAFAAVVATGKASRVLSRILTAERYEEGLAEDAERAACVLTIDPILIPHVFDPMADGVTCRTMFLGRTCDRSAAEHEIDTRAVVAPQLNRR